MTLYGFSIVLQGILPAFLLLALARQDKKQKLPHPLRILAWTLILGYSLKSIYLAFAVDFGLPFRTDHFTADHIAIGQAMLSLGVFCFATGYLAIGRHQLQFRSIFRSKINKFGRVLFWPVFFTAIALTAYIFYLKGFHLQLLSLRFVSVSQYVNQDTGIKSALGFLLLGSDFIFVFFLYYLASDRGLLRPNLFVPAIILVALNYFLSSQRTGVLVILIASVLVSRVGFFNFMSRTATKRLLLIGLTLLLLSTSSFIRSERREVSLTDISISAGITTTMIHAFEGAYALDPAKLTGIALRNREYLMGESFLMFIVAPIPRALWPEKPVVRIGPYVAQEILEYNNKSGAPPSAIGELFINFGWAGVTIGMLFLGSFVALVRNSFEKVQSLNTTRVHYALFMIVVINFIIGDFSYAALTAIKYSVAAFIGQAHFESKSRNVRRQKYSASDITA